MALTSVYLSVHRPGDWSKPHPDAEVQVNEPTTFCTVENMNTSSNCAAYQLFDVVADPSERKDLYATAGHESVVAELKAMYDAEREVAVYPCLRGVAGRANEDGVLQPWLSPHDLCEP